MAVDLFKVMGDRSTSARVSKLAEGRAPDVLSHESMLHYIDVRCRAIFTNTSYGVEFVKIVRCSARETVELLNKRKVGYDIQESTMWMARLEFKIGGERIIRHTYIPYVKDIHILISGMQYTVTDVISDKLISPGMNDVFIRFLKNKVRVFTSKHMFTKNNQITTYQFPCTQPLNPRESFFVPKTPVLLYFLYKYGFVDTMARLHGVHVKMVKGKDKGKYNPDKYLIYGSAYIHHSGGGTRGASHSTDLSRVMKRFKTINGKPRTTRPDPLYFIVKKKDVHNEKLLDQTMSSLLYIMDCLDDVDEDFLLSMDNIEHITALMIFKENNSGADVVDLRKKLRDKMGTLDGHVSSYMVDRIREQFGNTIEADDAPDGFYKLLMHVYRRYMVWRISSRWIMSTVIDKRFEILEYLTEPLFFKLNTLSFTLHQSVVAKGKVPDVSVIRQKFNRELTMSIMFEIRRNTISVHRVSYGGDNKYLKNTSTLHVQFCSPASTGNLSKKRTGGKGVTTDPLLLISEDHALVGTAAGVSKGRDSVLKYLNLFCPYNDATKSVDPSPDTIERMRPFAKMLNSMSNRSRVTKIPREFDVNLQQINIDSNKED